MTGWRRGKCDCCDQEVCGDCDPVCVDSPLVDITINVPATTQYAIACDCETSWECACDDPTNTAAYEGFSTSVPGWSATARSAGGCAGDTPVYGSEEVVYACSAMSGFSSGHVNALMPAQCMNTYSSSAHCNVACGSEDVVASPACCEAGSTTDHWVVGDRFSTDARTNYCGGYDDGSRFVQALIGKKVQVAMYTGPCGRGGGTWTLRMKIWSATGIWGYWEDDTPSGTNLACTHSVIDWSWTWPYACFTTKESTDGDVNQTLPGSVGPLSAVTGYANWVANTGMVATDLVYVGGTNYPCWGANMLGTHTVIPVPQWTARHI